MITASGGTNGGLGGTVSFGDTSDGGTARAIINGNGSFDISQLTDGGMNIGSIEGNGSFFLGANTLTVGGNNLSTTFSGIIADGGSRSGTGGSLVKTGGGTLILSGANTYTGTTTVNGGTLQIGDVNNAGSLAGGAVGVNSGGTFALVNVSGNALANNITNGVGGVGTVTVNSANSITLSGKLTDGAAGKLALTQNGAGTTVLTNTNSYTGATTVNAGTLVVNGSLATGSTVTVNSTGTLAGTGTVAGTVNVLSGGTLNPGGISTPGTLTIGNLVLNAGSTLNFRLAQAGVAGGMQNDFVNLTGNLTLAGTLNVTQLAGFGVGTYTLFDFGGILTDNNFSAINGLSGFTVSISTSVAHEVELIVSNVAQQYWDGTTTTGNGSIHGGTGNWNTTTTNWTNIAGTTNTNWKNDGAVFGGTAGTVTLTSAITAQQLTFNTTGYVLAGTNTLTLTGASPIISVANAGTTATISAPIGGTVGLTASGLGTLILTSATNSYTGATTISTGTLQIGTTATAGKISAAARSASAVAGRLLSST